jgi:FkbM family methyltransferase
MKKPPQEGGDWLDAVAVVRGRLRNYRAPMTEPEFLQFARYEGPGEPGFFRDFLGVKTRTSYVPLPDYVNGHVFGYPSPDERFLHSVEEWAGVLRSVLEASSKLVALELGAGWGPWIVAAGVAAKQRDISDIHLIGVEAFAEHAAYMSQHIADNSLLDTDHQVIQAMVGVTEGTTDYAGSNFRGQATTSGSVPLVSLTKLIAPYDRVDIGHCDIQGAEGDVLPSALPQMSRNVRRVVVGTHSRLIEDRLFVAFQAEGWKAEAEAACAFKISEGSLTLVDDGVQVWSNPRL